MSIPSTAAPDPSRGPAAAGHEADAHHPAVPAPTAPAAAGHEADAVGQGLGDPAPDGAAAPQATTEQSPPAHRWGPSPVTVVWGLVLVLIAAVGAGYGLFGLTADPILVGALLVAGCGLLLVVVAAVSARRRPDGGGPGAPHG